MIQISWQEHDCTGPNCGAHHVIEWVDGVPSFKKPVLDEDGEVASLKAVTACRICGAQLSEQLEISQ